MRLIRATAAVVLSLAVLTGTGGALQPASAQPSKSPDWVQDTFVDLEQRKFPKAARSACRKSSRTLRVPSRQHATITSALASARPGTTIRVSAGSYRENLRGWFALQSATNRICLLSKGGRVRLTAAPGQKYGLLLAGSRTVVKGFTLDGFEVGVSLGRDSGRSQRKVTLQRIRIHAITTGWSEGVVAYPDHRGSASRRPVVKGLFLKNVRITGVQMGVSCNAGPCTHWRLHKVHVAARSGDGDSGADSFALESGRQVVISHSRFGGAGGDGIDIKGEDVVIRRTTVQAARNGIKLWQGGDVSRCRIQDTGADAALVGESPSRYRYRAIEVVDHDPSGTGYVGTWGYDTQRPVQLQILNSSFAQNSSGGLYAPSGSAIQLDANRFADRGTKLLDVGGLILMTNTAGLAELQQRGWGSGNRID